ncbi:ATP-binding cassette domain-containing protein [Actinomadura macrotermitis]|uniref:UvrABC system protein A n=1 Tax=Actinomadura macrotermitis TaxID=2585200 RepID=A0A7K0C5V7_9ACTN|nr:excinuclease ABC subunit UvrA [Actinomadura macrotermitis]MQY08798.1 UvrABC system protein A [Actinomadura macrotermitis]
MSESIVISGARENNLKDVSLRIPKERIVVFTGVSGSGKSSLVFGTVAVEARRRLNEIYSWHVRDRLPKHERPDADAIENLTPAVVVDQRPIGGNARSTVGTATGVQPMIRVLFSRHAVPSAGEASRYSFNDPQGMCPRCDGLGRTARLDLDRILDTARSLDDGAIVFPPFAAGTFTWQLYAESGLFDPGKPLRDFTEDEWRLFLHGDGFRVPRRNRNGTQGDNAYEGIVRRFDRLYLNRDPASLPERTQALVRDAVTRAACPECGGARLNKAALAGKIDGRTIADFGRMEITDLIAVLGAIGDPVAQTVAQAAADRLRRLESAGLGHLTLDRPARALSGGEAQRLKIVRYLGSGLTGMTYIFDEPSAGLHPRDVARLNDLLRRLRDQGNTVLVVEHDPGVIAAADHVVDLGPGAGTRGGRVVFQGPVARLRQADTPTGRSLRRAAPLKDRFREPAGWLTVAGARSHNLKDVTARFPVGVLTAITGVAGSGKSTLVATEFRAAHPEAIMVDQSAATAARRACPATHLDIMDRLRRLFAGENGAPAGLFSFNSTGACPACAGHGTVRTDLAFMDPVTTLCHECRGTRYRPEALRHTVRGKTIADVLAMTAEEALAWTGDPHVERTLRTLTEVGLGYLTLGRSLDTLSGGERQRLKLAGHLHRDGEIYVLDEPTTGLHPADTATLLALLDRLVDRGNTVLVIEHDLDVVKHADWVVDLGPGGGRHGGEIVFAGTPADLARDPHSATAAHLRAGLAHAA